MDEHARFGGVGLPYPGGPAIDRAAREGNPRAVAFPRAMTGARDARMPSPSPG